MDNTILKIYLDNYSLKPLTTVYTVYPNAYWLIKV